MSSYSVESCAVETTDGVKLNARVFRPKEEEQGGEVKNDSSSLAIVLVHPYSILGGCQGLLKGIASGLANKGFKAVTFDMRGVGRSTGKASLTGFAEVEDVIAVCKWVSENLPTNRILLVGSSAGMICFLLFAFWCRFDGSCLIVCKLLVWFVFMVINLLDLWNWMLICIGVGLNGRLIKKAFCFWWGKIGNFPLIHLWKAAILLFESKKFYFDLVSWFMVSS